MWYIGNEIVFSKDEYNDFFRFYCEYTIAKNDEKIPIEQKLKEYGILIRELIYEEIREKNFSDLPSRRHCIWLCDIEGLEFWKNNLEAGAKIYEVEATGNIHEAYEDSLDDNNINYKTLSNLAKEYWSGQGGKRSCAKEYLLEGKIVILNELSNP